MTERLEIGQNKIFEGYINPNSLRSVQNPMEGPLHSEVIVAQDAEEVSWMNWDNMWPPEPEVDGQEELNLRTGKLVGELDYIDRIMKVSGFVFLRENREPVFLEWGNTWSFWIPFEDYERHAQETIRKVDTIFRDLEE